MTFARMWVKKRKQTKTEKQKESMNMQTIRIGASGVEAPALGVGTWAWGDKLT